MEECEHSGQDAAYRQQLRTYESDLELLKLAMLQKTRDKNTFCTHAFINGDLNVDYLNKALGLISKCDGNSDFSMLSLIRLLFLDETKFSDNAQFDIRSAKERICQTLNSFPFWPASDEAPRKDINDIVFWSENHLFMTLSSAYLFYQYHYHSLQRYPDNYAPFVDEVFIKYLELHLHDKFDGVYEANSHVYLPYTLSALFNLFDYAEERSIRNMAEALIDKILYHIMLCTDPLHGVANLSASARAFPRTRLRNHGHNINQLINLMVGHSPDDFFVSQLADLLCTTSWRPKAMAFEALHFDGFLHRVRISHALDDTEEIYGYSVFATSAKHVDEYVPLCWSAGLIVHPLFVQKTRLYQRRKHMSKNTHLWPLAYGVLTDNFYASSMEKYTHFSSGQLYTDFDLNVYKEPTRGLVLSSFELFNVHNAGFQQLPWMANVSGIPFWTQSGSGTEGVLGFGMHNTHNPAVQQRHGLLVATYLAPQVLTGTFIVKNMFPYMVRFFWPKAFFGGEEVNEQLVLHHNFGNGNGRQHSSVYYDCAMGMFSSRRKVGGLQEMVWSVARVRDCFIGVLCTAQSKWDKSESKDAMLQPMRTDHVVCVPRRVCEAKQHSWIVVVGTVRDYSNLQEFINQRLLKIVISEETGSLYDIIVEDGDQRIEYSLDTTAPPASESGKSKKRSS